MFPFLAGARHFVGFYLNLKPWVDGLVVDVLLRIILSVVVQVAQQLAAPVQGVGSRVEG
jgi:hypothetical protein